jgi:NitT/TauT family transport system substrate-binding protein
MAKKTFKIGYLPIVDHLILGMTKHKFDNQLEKNEYADIELVKIFGWNEMGDGLINGTLDMGFMLAPYAMDVYYTKKNIKLILLSHRDGSMVVTNKRANINTLQDFKGKTVLIPFQASMHHIILHKLLESEGLSVGIGKDVMTEVVAPVQIPMMIGYDTEGMIAGYVAAEPLGSISISAGYGNILRLSKEVIPSHACCTVVARDDIIEQYPEAVQELCNSFVRSGQEVKSNLADTIKVASSFLEQDEAMIKTILEDPQERVTMDKLMPTLEELDFIQNYLIDTVSRPAISGKIEMDKFVDLKFATAAGAK